MPLIEAAQARSRAVNAPHLVALVRASATFRNGKLVERPDEHSTRSSRLKDLHLQVLTIARLAGFGSRCRVGRSPCGLPVALRSRGCVAGYAAGVSAERDELRRLVEQLSEDRVPAVLAEARRQSESVPAGEWPPAWFGSFASGRSDLGSDHEDLLAEGFGRS
jgi:hypothetical protein